ncbi:hypothetical protein NCWK1_2420 [Nostoc cycadae WK-1]|uniref:Uncharacterized protein n=1 Tax=Nostoc cycadae WK-1 TaxID=1861711 RepID=A0A2H6LHL0_9NOSO|nr:hypothetical protein NCWK1_2420 [Nostoc cycadae WK-1]
MISGNISNNLFIQLRISAIVAAFLKGSINAGADAIFPNKPNYILSVVAGDVGAK